VKKALSRELLTELLDTEDIESTAIEEITRYFLKEEVISQFAPDGICQIDPRNGDRIIYNSARAKRPHDNRPVDPTSAPADDGKGCLICQGKTTRVLDVTDLSEGFTFINKNLFPIFFPSSKDPSAAVNEVDTLENASRCNVRGCHFLQWTSSQHDRDWHNMPLEDRVIVMRRLAVLEKKMLSGSSRYVSIIKNYGRLVGGSLAHGHQQIGTSNIMPNRTRQNKIFQEKRGMAFSSYMLGESPKGLIIRDYGTATLITPFFMRRPYDMFLILKDPSKSYLYMLDADELADISDGWRDAIRIMLAIMPEIGRETAYNITTHNGQGAGLYFEFLPYTQEMGGFEHLGLYLCQGNPETCAALARQVLHDYPQ